MVSREEYMKNHLLIVGIVFLFVGLCFQPAFAKHISISIPNDGTLPIDGNYNGDVIIVDDEGDGDYTSIKDAVNNANPGDTIEVYSGRYEEYNITIHTKDITLEGISYELGTGNDSGKPIIKAIEEIWVMLFVEADNVVIQNFVIEGVSVPNLGYNVVVFRYNQNCVLSNCEVIHNGLGSCVVVSGKFHKIMFNNITKGDTGIRLNGNNITVQGNRINKSSSGAGIDLTGNDNNILSNIINDCENNGIMFWVGANNIIRNNVIKKCQIGIFIDIWENAKNNLITFNEINENLNGILLMVIENEGGVYIHRNNFINNKVQILFMGLFLPFFYRHRILNENYWSNCSGIFPKVCFGISIFPIGFIPGGFPFIIFLPIPRLVIDWHPAKEPYDIPSTQGCGIE
jgi:nitrous oxidase accessory protein NosD